MIRQFLETFRKPSARSLAQRELEDAQRQQLSALSAAEYAKNLATYQAERIKRLTAYLKDAT